MAKLKLHYAGWLLLPAAFREALGLETGAMLEAELADGTIVLRPAGEGRGAATAPLPDAPARRKPGRPRKVQAAELPVAAASPRPRGRPRKVLAEVAAAPASGSAPSELRRKAASPTLAVEPGAVRPEPAAQDTARAPEERRPFRRVEVRKLGPGRGHNKPQGPA